jgi:hypothetical protein
MGLRYVFWNTDLAAGGPRKTAMLRDVSDTVRAETRLSSASADLIEQSVHDRLSEPFSG